MNDAVGERRRWMRWAAWILCVLPLAALADQPAEPGVSAGAPNGDLSTGVDHDPNSPGDGSQRRSSRRRPTEDEWNAASAFLEQYSPKRMALARELPDGLNKQRLRSVMYGSYLALRRVQDVFPQIYQLELQRLTIEDNLFDIHRQFTRASGPQKAALKSDLQQQVQALFDNVQQDRQARIDRMKSWVAELQTRHDDDARNRDAVITQQLQDVIQHGPNALPRENGSRRNGGGPSSPKTETSEPNFQPTTNPQP